MAFDTLDARRGTPGEEPQQGIPGQGRPIGDGEAERVAGVGLRRCPPHGRRGQAVVRPEQGIETPDALEPAGECHPHDRQVRIGEQLLGQEEATGLGQLDRRDAVLLADGPAELSRAEAQVAGERLQAPPFVQRAGLDPVGRDPGGSPHRIDRGVTGRQLGAAPQTGPESLALGQRRVGEEPATVASGRPRRADRPAIDPRRRDPHEEEAIESSVTRRQGPVTGLIVDSHGSRRSLPGRIRSLVPMSEVYPLCSVVSGRFRTPKRNRYRCPKMAIGPDGRNGSEIPSTRSVSSSWPIPSGAIIW